MLTNLEFSQNIFEKHWNTKFRENPSSGSRTVPCGRADRRTDRHEKGNGLFPEFFERAPPPPPPKKGNYLTWLLVESRLCDDASFHCSRYCPNFKEAVQKIIRHCTISGRVLIQSKPFLSVYSKDILKLPLFPPRKTRFFFRRSPKNLLNLLATDFFFKC